MLKIALAVLWFLVGLCIIVGVGFIALWVFGQLGIPIPPMAVHIAEIILGLLCLIWLVRIVASGGDVGNPFKPGPPL